MRIGEMATMMLNISRNQDMFATKFNQSQMQLATGKRVNSASDDPGAIARIERTKANLSETQIVQKALEDGINRNSAMETTLDSLSSSANSLSDLAVQNTQPGADTTTIQAQAKSLLDSMVDNMASTDFNGVNPFTQGTTNVRVSGGGSIQMDAPKFSITRNTTDPTTYDIRLNDGTTLSGQSVTNILDSNFITNNITNQVSGAKSLLGTSTDILNFRKDFETSKEDVLTKTLSNLQDADLGQATINSNIAKQMMTMNDNLLASASSTFANQVGSIMDIRV